MEVGILISVDADVYPTEDPEKVLKAVKAIFPAISLEVKWLNSYARVEGSAEGYGALENLKKLLRERRIRAAARSILKSSIHEDVIVFYLNKQAAYAGKTSFTEPFVESPLPPIRVIIKAPNLEEVISWLTE